MLLNTAISILFIFIFLNVFDYSVEENEDHPNVLLISADDLKDWVGYLDGYEGKVHTPNIDRLASEGFAFTNAHTSATVCCPSRNAMMLGKRPCTIGLYDNGQWWKAAIPGEIPLPQYFKQHGYYAAGAGKVFHHTPGNNPPCSWNEYHEQVIDDPWNFAGWSPERFFVTYGYRGEIIPYPDWKPLNGIYPIRSELDWGPIPGKKEIDYGDVEAVDFAVNFLNRKQEKPFFLAVGIYRPHLPWHVPQKYFDIYPFEEIVLPEIQEGDLDDIPEQGRKLALATNRDFRQIREEGKWKEAVQAYLASISFADEQVGRVLNVLSDSPFKENTIVVFWSDHGWHLGTKQHWHKQTLWEECTQIPFVIDIPWAEQSPLKCDKPVDIVNVFPTLISLCNLPQKNDLDGHDMTPLLQQAQPEWDFPALTEIKTGNMSVRSENWHYIRYSDGSEELYDCKKDPHEWNNLILQSPDQKVLEAHRKWIPETFARPAPGKADFYFDPYAHTFLHRETKSFIDGKN